MSVRSHKTRTNYHDRRTPPICKPVGNSVDDKRKAFLEARNEYEDAIRKAGKVPGGLKEESASLAKSAVRGGIRIVSEIVNAGARVGDAVERDMRRNSVQGDIDRAIVNAMYDKKKTRNTSSKTKSKKAETIYKITDIKGNTTYISENEFPKKPRSRRY